MAEDLITGHDPYSFDLGESEIVAWLAKNLTGPELGERQKALDSIVRLQGEMRFGRVSYRLWRIREWLVRPLCWPARRRIWRLDALAIERGGPRPEPSWKIRHDWGVARG